MATKIQIDVIGKLENSQFVKCKLYIDGEATPILIIPQSEREQYISALKCIKKEGTDEYLIDFFFKTSIKRMEKEISEKVNMTRNFVSGMDFFKKKQADSEPEL